MYFWLLQKKNIRQRLKTGFVVQGHIFLILPQKPVQNQFLEVHWCTIAS